MNSAQIRQAFLDYFAQQKSAVVASSSLIPAEDPTLLFTNAGMNQFKDCFLGKEKRSYNRATSIQKCVRAGGKHNDLDQVGYTERHLTFFEMMGNFSFGDYFKDDAIRFAWELLTEKYKLDKSKLFISVYKNDDEAYEIWNKKMGVPTERIIRLGEKDNFWQMGDTGPCGPCTEIYVDQGAEEGCRAADCLPGCFCSRYTEIWNLVFMQFDRQPSGELKPLAKPGVDTGMGFERLCMIMQGVKNVFKIDSFQELINFLVKTTGAQYQGKDGETQAAFHVLADHIRSTSLLIADGCSPANEGRGYVLRKIIRRAALFAQKLSNDRKLFSKLAAFFIDQMKEVYPELQTNRGLIISVLDSEIERFADNLVNGQGILDRYMEEQRKQSSKEITGAQAFKLYDTYGFPLEITRIIAERNSFTIDNDGFEVEMKKQQDQSGKKVKGGGTEYEIPDHMNTVFVGYETLVNQSPIQYALKLDGYAWLSTKESPFYVECGGQVNDNGWVMINGENYPVLDLAKAGDTFKPAVMVKIATTSTNGKLLGDLTVGMTVTNTVDMKVRPHTVKNHTATHMLQAALIQILGPQVKQAGSLVNDKYLRFDFSHHKAMTHEEIIATENLVNAKIQENIKTNIMNATLAEAKQKGVISFFGEKYNPESVRIVEIPGFSAELCGGTHAPSTGIIGAFKIISEVALSTGTRRMVAITGPEALKSYQLSFDIAKALSTQFKVKPEEILTSIEKQQQQLIEAQRTIKHLRQHMIKTSAAGWAAEMTHEHGIPFLYLSIEEFAGDELKTICQELEKYTPGFYVIINKPQPKVAAFNFYLHVSGAVQANVDLKKCAEWLRTAHNLKGGGSGGFLQGGGTQVPEHFRQAIVGWLGSK
jgi:alanyl-tRNA synthetase